MIEPQVVTMPLPHCRRWLRYADLNIVALAPHLDDAGREEALDEMRAEWRASVSWQLAAVPCPEPAPRPLPVPVMARVPFCLLPASAV